jgi:hypothetical protein
MRAAAIVGDSFKNNFKLIKSRGTLYLCDLHSSQVGRGIRYDNLRRSYSVFFCGFKMFEGEEPIHHFTLRFSHADKPERSEVVNEIVSRREAIKVADTILRSISTDPDMRAKYRSRMKFRTDLNTTIAVREDQAREQERNDIARNLFALNLSDADIAKATGLTLDEIMRLRNGE